VLWGAGTNPRRQAKERTLQIQHGCELSLSYRHGASSFIPRDVIHGVGDNPDTEFAWLTRTRLNNNGIDRILDLP